MNHKTGILAPSTPCQRHPVDWLDPTRTALTRQLCLTCPGLTACAQAAHRDRPDYGMWAGVWIDGDFTAKEHLLGCQNPVHEPTTPAVAPQTPGVRLSWRAPGRARHRRVGKLCTAAPPAQLAALITARAAGHCEIMAPACTYQQSAIFTRRRAASPTPLGSPADALAACRNCIDLIEHTATPTALDLGYIVDPRSCTSTVALLWRQHRWVYLDTRGRLHRCEGPTQAVTS
ncbi:WhiB family transcriptional regulator [Mycobacterium paragordonae]|uniref:WhiB family transcriptional regulator n=1 Tax=Mycobacterium paragordonae TaxID=1389713 RepID=UPI0018CC0D91|nr:WhiB family transcriptional regulator [Mycobacterium paragordonae]